MDSQSLIERCLWKDPLPAARFKNEARTRQFRRIHATGVSARRQPPWQAQFCDVRTESWNLCRGSNAFCESTITGRQVCRSLTNHVGSKKHVELKCPAGSECVPCLVSDGEITAAPESSLSASGCSVIPQQDPASYQATFEILKVAAVRDGDRHPLRTGLDRDSRRNLRRTRHRISHNYLKLSGRLRTPGSMVN